MLNKIVVLSAVFTWVLFWGGTVLASPANEHKAENNPNVVAYYDNPSSHTVIQPDGSIKYDQKGKDLVQQAGKNFQQFYEDEEGGNRVHTLFRNVGSDTSCDGPFLFLENPYNPPTGDTWGYYFPEGDNYCVKSNFQKQ